VPTVTAAQPVASPASSRGAEERSLSVDSTPMPTATVLSTEIESPTSVPEGEDREDVAQTSQDEEAPAADVEHSASREAVVLRPQVTDGVGLGAYLEGTPYDSFEATEGFEGLINHRLIC